MSTAAVRRNSSSSDNMTQLKKKKRGNSLVFRIALLLRSLADSLYSARSRLLLRENQACFAWSSMAFSCLDSLDGSADLSKHLLAIF